MSASRPVTIIAGMHRSGTSLVASLARAAGIDVGARLLRANYDNPRGFFEDEDFRELHEAVLRRQGRDALGPDFAVVAPEARERAQALALIAARGTNRAWGFKDPRATLFLEFWDELLPDARYVLLYRHPAEVALSLLRRGDPGPARSPWRAVRAWEAYNARLLAFAAGRGDRVTVVNAHAAAAAPMALATLLASGAGLAPPAGLGGVTVARGELTLRVAADADLDWHALLPQAMARFAELESVARFAEPARPSHDGGAAERAEAASEALLFHVLDLSDPEAATLAARPGESRSEVAALRREAEDLRQRLATYEASRVLHWWRRWRSLRDGRDPAEARRRG